MKHHIRTLACGAALLAALAMLACGGKQTMASKSAAAYDEAKKKGIPIASGEHGGHWAESGAEPPASAAATRIDHATTPGMDHGAMTGMDHSKMSGMDHSAMAGMEHSKMPGMTHGSFAAGSHEMAGMTQSSMAGMDHSAMPGMAHGSTGMSGMRHGSPMAAPIVIAPPTSNAAIAQTQPAATLRADEFDAPVPAAVEEAAKAASGKIHSMEATPKSPTSPQHDHASQPQPPSGHHHHGGGEAL
jgi:uncharacterized protein involved in copper resistance